LSDERVDRVIDQIERALQTDAPALVRQFDVARRADDRNTIAVAGLLVIAVVLMTVGFATYSWFAWAAGATAFVASTAVDQRFKRNARRGALRSDLTEAGLR
jgi:hypothetical protein